MRAEAFVRGHPAFGLGTQKAREIHAFDWHKRGFGMGLHMRDPVRRELAEAFEHGQGGMARGRCRAIGKEQLQLRRKAHDGLTGFVVRDHHIVQFLIFDFLVHGFSFQLVTAAHLAASRSGSGAAVLPGSEKIQATSPTAIPTPAQQSPLWQGRGQWPQQYQPG